MPLQLHATEPRIGFSDVQLATESKILTSHLINSQEVAEAQEKLQQERRAREEAAVEAARIMRRETRACRLETHFADVCPALVMPHAQKHLRKITDALEPHG